MRLIFATNNNNKLEEIKDIIGITAYEYKKDIFSLKDLNIVIDPDENGNSFVENANIKSLALYNELKSMNLLEPYDYIIADDTGLCIDYLNGEPGIMSARYMGKETKQIDKNKKILEIMKDVPDEKRTAYFITILSVIYVNESMISGKFDENNIKNFEGKIEGKIAKNIDGDGGFGYDPIFEVNGVTYSRMGESEKNLISHRSRAINNFIKYLKNM